MQIGDTCELGITKHQRNADLHVQVDCFAKTNFRVPDHTDAIRSTQLKMELLLDFRATSRQCWGRSRPESSFRRVPASDALPRPSFFQPARLLGRPLRAGVVLLRSQHAKQPRLRTLQSPLDTVVACIVIRTSLSLGAGLSTSLNWRRSAGPYWVCRIAFTTVPFGVVVHTACYTEFVLAA